MITLKSKRDAALDEYLSELQTVREMLEQVFNDTYALEVIAWLFNENEVIGNKRPITQFDPKHLPRITQALEDLI